MKVSLSNNAVIDIDDNPIASGGEADIHEILSPASYDQQVLKIYKLDKRTTSKEEKLSFLIKNQPALTALNSHHSVIWPIHLAFSNKNFIGYTMSKAFGIKLELLCHPKLPKNLPKEWDKFSFQSPGVLQARLKLCFNICAALSQVHSFGSYVLVDMKPDNIMVKFDGLISIIDIDSIEIIENNKILYPAHVATPEYTPPEYYKTIKDIEKTLINETWDRFSIAVILYRVLFGIHPYAGSLNPPFDGLSNIGDFIKNGLFPNGKNKSKFKVVPPPHRNFAKIDIQLQHLFKNAFDESYFNNNLRPTSDDWCRALSPDPVIQINRKLPTKTISCFTPIYTQDIQLKLLPEFVVKKPLFLSEAKASVFSKFFKSFKKNEKDKVFKQILVLQLKVDGLIKEIERIRSNLLFERKKIENQKTDILKEEKEIIDKHIKILFHPKAHVVDLKALNLINLEKDRRIAYQKKYKKEFNALELEIKELYEIHVNGFDSINNKKLDELKSSLSDCINLENNQIKKLDLELKIKLDLIRADIQKFEKDFYDKAESDGKLKLQAIETKKNKLKNKEKKLIDSALEKYQSSYSNNNLSQYKIYDDRYNIFTDSYADPDKIIKNLASHGITTAADIKGVDESGRILKSDGSWIKVPEVAKTRAKRLNEWRHKNERIHTSTPPPQSLPYTEELLVKQSLATELQSIEEEEKKIRQDVLNQKRGITYTLNQKLNEAKKIEQNEIQIIQTKKANIMQMFKIEKDTIQQRISSHLHSYDESKKGQIKIFEQMSSKLRSKIDRLESQKDDFDKKISEEFDQPHIQLITELKQLDNQFKDELNKLNIQKISELKIVKSSYENKHKKFMQELKDAADELNSTCSTLVTIQKQYSTMK